MILFGPWRLNQCWGSVTCWCGSGSGSPDPYLWLMDPDPTPFFGCKTNISYFFLYLTHRHIIFSLEIQFFVIKLHIYEKREGAGSGSVPLTNGNLLIQEAQNHHHADPADPVSDPQHWLKPSIFCQNIELHYTVSWFSPFKIQLWCLITWCWILALYQRSTAWPRK